MSDLPIIFSAPMVRALLEGRKGQTRRIARITAIMGNKVPVTAPEESLIELEAGEFRRGLFHYASTGALSGPYRLPYAVGDRLYVREACATWGRGPEREPVEFPVAYAADDPEWEAIKHDARMSKGDEWKIRPSIHMPRWASRLTLTVTDVRVQRLQDISEADAWAEGCKPGTLDDRGEPFPAEEPAPDGKGEIGWDCARDWYADLWDSLHGPEAWDANPWVAAYSFTVQRGNIDQIWGKA